MTARDIDVARLAFVHGEVPSLAEAARHADLSEHEVVEAAQREGWTLQRQGHLGPTFSLFGPPCCAERTYCRRCREACPYTNVVDLAAVRAAKKDTP